MIQIEKKYHFYAAHRNINADEKCGRIHGHTYKVICSFKFEEINKKSGVTLLFSEIDKLVEPIIKKYCHWLLLHEHDALCNILSLANEPYINLPFETSAENMAVWLFTEIKNNSNLPIFKISLAETLSSTVVYEP
jgi:6-pyruvoyltetrahydropterin/6-carboxytetrahydropterin synthase